MLGMLGVRDVGCLRCRTLGMWDIEDVGCFGIFGLLDVGMLDDRHVGCSGCEKKNSCNKIWKNFKKTSILESLIHVHLQTI